MSASTKGGKAPQKTATILPPPPPPLPLPLPLPSSPSPLKRKKTQSAGLVALFSSILKRELPAVEHALGL